MMMKCEYLKFMFLCRCASRWSCWCINESDSYFYILTFVLRWSVCKSMHETPACSIHQRPRINIIAPCDQFQRIQISAELRRWLLKTIRPYSRLLATIRTVRTIRYSLFPLFGLFAIRYSLFATICIIGIVWYYLLSLALTRSNSQHC